MAQITKGRNWETEVVTPTKLNDFLDDAVLAPDAIHTQTEKTTLAAADEELVWDSATNTLKRRTALNSRFVGEIIQSSKTSTGSTFSSSAAIPFDNTVPLIGEGTQLLSISFTPKSATSVIRLRFTGFCSHNTSGAVAIVAAFRDSVNCGAATWQQTTSNYLTPFAVEFFDSPASASAITYSIRVGTNSGAVVFNQNGAGSVFFGGAVITALVVEEIKQ